MTSHELRKLARALNIDGWLDGAATCFNATFTIDTLTAANERLHISLLDAMGLAVQDLRVLMSAKRQINALTARVAELEELVTSLWMHKPGDCDACNKLIAGRASG